ncbi:uncharacterized protein PAC_11393 [Phialocephala subalpina]|uniref:Zn(2)-C6 fungal-type domain-containing protein n=1 Tax=Phialocephala subalpina TaxID=576137 RepID=A0A1L7X928_9HELO|nr:uncharacterized protein PAC_11393 [Phialocephala subalpina]
MSQSHNHSTRRACTFCRKRKLRCSRDDPCSSCQKFGFKCQYSTKAEGLVRRTSTKVSRVHQLESRLGHVEQLLQSATQNGVPGDVEPSHTICLARYGESDEVADLDASTTSLLEQAFFDFVSPVINIIHQIKYTESTMNASTIPPSYLRHAICALGALKLEAQPHWSERLYHSSRRKLEEVELKDCRLDRVNLFQCQAWVLIALYELERGYFHRESMSTARAVQMVHLLKLHRHDALSRTHDPTLILVNTAKDITEAEERRRVFWQAFLLDRYNSVSLSTPPLIQENNICTYLPASNDAFVGGVEEEYFLLSEALKTKNRQRISSYAASVVLLSRAVTKLTDLESCDIATTTDELMDVASLKENTLRSALTTSYNVPEYLDLSASLLDPSIAYLYTATPTATIIVHRTARFRDNNSNNTMPTDILQHSRTLCLEAASTITMIMEITSGWDPRSYHFLIVYSIYCAAYVFATSWLEDQRPAYEKSLRFLLRLLETFKQHIQLAQTMLRDIDDDFPALQNRLNSRDRPSGAMQQGSFQFASSEPVFDLSRSGAHLDLPRMSEYGSLFEDTGIWNTEEDLLFGSFLS